uniref:MFS transporter n=1 Tax=Panagrolaimus sp. JU765 TaxID=591449 RepID=A0AC34PYZ7_9BILA
MTVIEKKFSEVINGEHVDIMEIEPFHRNAPEYRCCCHQIHYTKGSFYIALLTIIISAIGITLSAQWNYWLFFIPFVLFIILAIFVIIAYKTEKRILYLPYIIIMGILIIAAFMFAILGIVSIIFVPEWTQDFAQNVESKVYLDKQQKIDESRIFYTIATVSLLVFIAIASWFTFVIYKAYNFMKELHIARNPKRFMMELKTHHGIDEIEETPKLARHSHVQVEINAYNFMKELHIARNPKRFMMELKTHHGIDEIEETPKLARHSHVQVEINGEHSPRFE